MTKQFMPNRFDKFQHGIHLYINIKNLEHLVSEDEKDEDMNHIFSLLNTFVVSMENYIVSNYRDNVYFEKLTGGRIHLIIEDSDYCADQALDICKYARVLSKEVVKFQQTQSISKVDLQFGMDYGAYVDFDFKSDDGYEEYTSIGACANFACKLQIEAYPNELLLSEDALSHLSEENRENIKELDATRQDKIDKQKQYKDIYCLSLADLCENLSQDEEEKYEAFIERARQYSNDHPLKNMDTIEPKSFEGNFTRWNLSNNAAFDAAVVFADVRGFTKQFNPNNSNLNWLANLTKQILNEMYQCCEEHKGIHVQFQGDREQVFFEGKNYENAIVFALELSERIQRDGQKLGIGVAFGRAYAASLGKYSERSELDKQNALIGNVVSYTSRLEDECAKENEIVISKKLYDKIDNYSLKKLFEARDFYYVTSSTYQDFFKLTQNEIQEENHVRDYRKPWQNHE